MSRNLTANQKQPFYAAQTSKAYLELLHFSGKYVDDSEANISIHFSECIFYS